MKKSGLLTKRLKRVMGLALTVSMTVVAVPFGAYAEESKVDSFEIKSQPENPSDGAQNEYAFSFKSVDEENSDYIGYVYGEGVTNDVCELLAEAYFDASTNTSSQNKVIASNQEFVDANKSSVEHEYDEQYDSQLCWAYSASNALVQTEWIKKANAGIFNGEDGTAAQYFTSEDDLASYAAYCLVNKGGLEVWFWDWIFTGDGKDAELKFGADADDALLNEYYTYDLYDMYKVNERSLKPILNDYVLEKSANTMDIYYSDGSGHAMSINGFIYDNAGTPVAVIVTDPDDMVEPIDQPDSPADKSKAYSVYPIKYDGTNWIFDLDDVNDAYYDTHIGYISSIPDSTGKEKLDNTSIIPDSTRAISAGFDNEAEYSMDGSYTFDIPLNFDFLSFYDINKLKYRVLNESDEIIAEKSVEKSKSQWKALLDSNAVSVSLLFDDALGNAQNGNYKIQVEIDKDCFFGNYGWFAEKANYFDRLVDVWVNLFRDNSIPSDSSDDNTGKSEEQNAQESVDEAVYVSVRESVLNEILAQIDVDYMKLASNEAEKVEFDDANASSASISEDAIKKNVRTIVTDLLKLTVADANTVNVFNAAGIDVSSIDVQKLDVVLSTAVKVSKPGVARLVRKSTVDLNNKEVIAMIKLSDGTYRYVKAVVLADGSIEVSLPQDAVEMTIVALTKKAVTN